LGPPIRTVANKGGVKLQNHGALVGREAGPSPPPNLEQSGKTCGPGSSNGGGGGGGASGTGKKNERPTIWEGKSPRPRHSSAEKKVAAMRGGRGDDGTSREGGGKVPSKSKKNEGRRGIPMGGAHFVT